MRAVKAISSVELDRSDEELRSLRQQIQDLQQVMQSQRIHLEEKDQIITQKDETIVELRQQTQQLEGEKERELRQKGDEIDRLARQLGRVNQQLEESERTNAQFQRRIAQPEQLRPFIDSTSSSSKKQRASIKLTWREGEKAPCEMINLGCATADDSTLYVRVTRQIFSYTISTSSWSQPSEFPDSPVIECPPIVINKLLTLVGGNLSGTLTNQLFSLTGEGSGRRWTEEFPPMPTNRRSSTALCIGTALIVAGGWNGVSVLQTVEVLNTETLQWSTAADIPQPLATNAQAAVCGDHLYILGVGSFAFKCSVSALIQPHKSFLASIRNRGTRVWKEVATTPVVGTTYVSIHGRLLAIGGWANDQRCTTAVQIYNPTFDSWKVISHMRTPRSSCIAAVFPNNQLMVVGGDVENDAVEFASID